MVSVIVNDMLAVIFVIIIHVRAKATSHYSLAVPPVTGKMPRTS